MHTDGLVRNRVMHTDGLVRNRVMHTDGLVRNRVMHTDGPVSRNKITVWQNKYGTHCVAKYV
jgi:hypothetical protein